MPFRQKSPPNELALQRECIMYHNKPVAKSPHSRWNPHAAFRPARHGPAESTTANAIAKRLDLISSRPIYLHKITKKLVLHTHEMANKRRITQNTEHPIGYCT